MRMPLRLEASYDISGYSAMIETILTAVETYGLILAHKGSALYVTGISNSR